MKPSMVWMDLGRVRRLEFPRIQGADVCGRVVEVGEGVSRDRIGERVIVRTMLRSPVGFRPFEVWTFGSECDGGFAQFAVAPAEDTRAVRSDLTDEELAAAPCSYSTAENMLHRAAVGSERVLVTGASGGVGLAAVQLAKRRGATVIAVCSSAKSASVLAEGADQTVDRDTDLVRELGQSSVDVVIDVVGGPGFSQLLDVLRPGGRYAVSGAIAGPIAETRSADPVPQGPFPLRLHVPGRRGLREPGRLPRERRSTPSRLSLVPTRRDRSGAEGFPRQVARRKARAHSTCPRLVKVGCSTRPSGRARADDGGEPFTHSEV